MIDEAIETHVRSLLSSAYPEVEEDQIIIRFPLSVLEPPRCKRGTSIGQERLTVVAIIANQEKLDRIAFMKLAKRNRLEIDGIFVEQLFIRTEQKDFIELIQAKGIMFTMQFLYDIED